MSRENSERNRLKAATAKHVMALWNVALAAGWRTVFTPSIGTALATGCHWLHVVCPACQQLGETDLRKLDIHPNASIGVVIRAMSCKRCSPHPPFARPLGATKRSWYSYDGWLKEPRRSPFNMSNRKTLVGAGGNFSPPNGSARSSFQLVTCDPSRTMVPQ